MVEKVKEVATVLKTKFIATAYIKNNIPNMSCQGCKAKALDGIGMYKKVKRWQWNY